MPQKLEDILDKDELTRDDLIYLLGRTDAAEEQALFQKAYQIKRLHVGTTVYFRGIIELSNQCRKNCLYCGIRRDNRQVERYTLSAEEVLEAARFAYRSRYGSVVIQSGERQDESFVTEIEELVHNIKAMSDRRLGITLSLGEQSEETYRRWFAAGAHRYLLRIETSNAELYRTLHPDDHLFSERVDALKCLHRLGYQAGTGVMIGLPGQTMADLADDILFFKALDVAMIGMGPYIPHRDTPLGHGTPTDTWEEHKETQLRQALRMIAVTRIFLKDVNIASTTALQAIDDVGRERGLLAGANVIMPNLTDPRYREGYQLYEGKPCMNENATQCAGCLERRIQAIGETIGYDQWGDSPHFLRSFGGDSSIDADCSGSGNQVEQR